MKKFFLFILIIIFLFILYFYLNKNNDIEILVEDINENNTTTYTYTKEKKLKEIKTVNTIVKYDFDKENKRIIKTVNNQITEKYLWLEDNKLWLFLIKIIISNNFLIIKIKMILLLLV